jgi:hypothetical protein
MKISVKRTGGFAGLSEELARIDTAEFEETTRRQIEQAVQAARFFELPERLAGDTIGADLFQYEITISAGDRRHTVTFLDDASAATAPLRKLVDTLSQLAL